MQRFWEKVDIKGKDDCWNWKKGGNHYPRFRFNKNLVGGHRVSYMLTHGDPGDLHICHTCDNPRCVNPNHLYAGTHQDNVNDRTERKRRHCDTQTHCRNGHPFSGDNLYVSKDTALGRNRPVRRCKICRQASNKASVARRNN